MPKFLISLAVLLAIVALRCGTADASGPGAISLTFNTSARAEGMGGAGVATVWGGDTNLWANPALLAFRPGIRYGTMHSDLAVGLADGITIDKQELTFGYAGIGLLYAEAPFDNVYLSLGEQQGTDENGNPTGTFEAWEKSRSWGLGAGATQVLDRFWGTDLNRWLDLAGGIVWRDFEDQLAPDNSIQGDGFAGGAQASTRDLGWVARVTPLNTLTQFESMADAPLGLVLEGTYGWAKQNSTDEFLVHADVDQSDPLPTAYVKGWTIHAEVVAGRAPTSGMPAILRDSFAPLFAWTYSEQRIEPGYLWTGSEYVYEHDTSGLNDEESRGYELLILNLVYVRRGHLTVEYGDIDGATTGWGINLQAGRYGGFRYDQATVPQARGLPTVQRDGWHFWVDLVAVLDAR